jgi:hypothetical protein
MSLNHSNFCYSRKNNDGLHETLQAFLRSSRVQLARYLPFTTVLFYFINNG